MGNNSYNLDKIIIIYNIFILLPNCDDEIDTSGLILCKELINLILADRPTGQRIIRTPLI